MSIRARPTAGIVHMNEGEVYPLSLAADAMTKSLELTPTDTSVAATITLSSSDERGFGPVISAGSPGNCAIGGYSISAGPTA